MADNRKGLVELKWKHTEPFSFLNDFTPGQRYQKWVNLCWRHCLYYILLHYHTNLRSERHRVLTYEFSSKVERAC